MNILIVDDDPSVSTLLSRILHKEGYNSTMVANSAKEAALFLGISKGGADTIDADLILMDVNMPEMDGIEAVRMIKEHKQFQDVPIIMITGNKEEEFLKRAFESGAMDYITKPFKNMELLARVRSALKLKEETDRRK